MQQILTAVAGLGLFLLGMQIMTDGLRGLAGGAIRRLLIRFTSSPVTGAATGAATTAVIQSSSATTVAAVGFVGAGLMTFEQALGVIFGANVGTTVTGWVVAIVGFKLELAQLAAPLVLFGALSRLLASGRWAHAGSALSGFALIFIGIDLMQTGMAEFQDILSPERFPPDTIGGRLLLVMLGMAITVVTQSSSAGVATALVALNVGAISFPQAAALVIGMDVGTTFTAALATLGGSVSTRRTGYAHVIYNVLTGIMAFALLSPYAAVVDDWADLSVAGDAQMALVGFHTTFNLLGTVLVLGVADRFARLVRQLVPESGPQLLSRLDDRLLTQPDVATDALAATVTDLANTLTSMLRDQLDPEKPPHFRRDQWRTIDEALEASSRFAGRIHTDDGQEAHPRHQAAIQALDHLNRLAARCRQEGRVAAFRRRPELVEPVQQFQEALKDLTFPCSNKRIRSLDDVRRGLRDQREVVRSLAIDDAAEGDIDIEAAEIVLGGVRWLHRNAYHVWRISVQTRAALGPVGQPDADKVQRSTAPALNTPGKDR